MEKPIPGASLATITFGRVEDLKVVFIWKKFY